MYQQPHPQQPPQQTVVVVGGGQDWDHIIKSRGCTLCVGVVPLLIFLVYQIYNIMNVVQHIGGSTMKLYLIFCAILFALGIVLIFATICTKHPLAATMLPMYIGGLVAGHTLFWFLIGLHIDNWLNDQATAACEEELLAGDWTVTWGTTEETVAVSCETALTGLSGWIADVVWIFCGITIACGCCLFLPVLWCSRRYKISIDSAIAAGWTKQGGTKPVEVNFQAGQRHSYVQPTAPPQGVPQASDKERRRSTSSKGSSSPRSSLSNDKTKAAAAALAGSPKSHSAKRKDALATAVATKAAADKLASGGDPEYAKFRHALKKAVAKLKAEGQNVRAVKARQLYERAKEDGVKRKDYESFCRNALLN